MYFFPFLMVYYEVIVHFSMAFVFSIKNFFICNKAIKIKQSLLFIVYSYKKY